jgi:outer membrane protein TolC
MFQVHRFIPVIALSLLSLTAVGAPAISPDSEPLALATAERLAFERHPQLAGALAEVDAARADAVASGQLPDPELRVGMENVPVDSFALDREPMSMVTVGVTQMFPPIGSLGAEQRAAEQSAAALETGRIDLAERLRLDVRRAWLATFYLDRALAINAENRDFIELVVEAELARLRAGAGDQAAVLKARLIRDELLDQQQSLRTERSQAAAALQRAIGGAAAEPVLPHDLPVIEPPVAQSALLERLAAHPQIEALEAQWRAAGHKAEAARSAYRPAFGVMAGYGYRQAREADGSQVPDMASIGVTISLPIFTDKRQDARLRARNAEALAARYARDDKLLELRAEVQARYAEYAHLGERLRLLEANQLPTAQQAVDTALAAYRSNLAPLSDVIEQLHARHEFNLRHWKLATDRGRVAAELVYLAATVEGGQ